MKRYTYLINEENTGTLLTGTCGTPQTVDILLLISGRTDLDDKINTGIVHTSGASIRGQKDARGGEGGLSEALLRARALGLAATGVDLEVLL